MTGVVQPRSDVAKLAADTTVLAMLHAGIDEAGYGPTLGPLVVATAWAAAADHATVVAALTATGVKDSKKLHKPGDLAPLETVALAGLRWATGREISTAAEVFAALGEQSADRDQPWQQGAEQLSVPVAARAIPTWRTPTLTQAGMAGRIIHPGPFNRFLATGANKAALELAAVGQLLNAPPATPARTTIVDRLGGRKFYRDFLADTFSGALILVDQEDAAASRYHGTHGQTHHDIAFVVGGESASPLTALASCVAKYARELHMRLYNQYWCASVPGLKPTAGYPEDAKRWLQDIGPERVARCGDALVRKA